MDIILIFLIYGYKRIKNIVVKFSKPWKKFCSCVFLSS